MPSGIDIKKSTEDLWLGEELRDASNNLLNTGTCDVRILKPVMTGSTTPLTVSVHTFDWSDKQFESGAVTDQFEAATYCPANNGTANTGLWAIGIKLSDMPVAQWPIGSVFIAEFIHSTGVVQKQIFQWGDSAQF